MNRVRADRPISGRLLPTGSQVVFEHENISQLPRKAALFLSLSLPLSVCSTYRRDYYRAVMCRLLHEGLGQGVTITTRLIPSFVYTWTP